MEILEAHLFRVIRNAERKALAELAGLGDEQMLGGGVLAGGEADAHGQPRARGDGRAVGIGNGLARRQTQNAEAHDLWASAAEVEELLRSIY